MSSSCCIPMDPNKMSNLFTQEDKILGNSISQERREIALERTREALKILPKRERDMLELYYFHKKDQVEIGKLFKVTQGDVSYRIARAVKRMQFYLSLPRVCLRRMARDLTKVLPNKLHVTIMLGMYRTTSQTAVAVKIGLSQGKVRYRFMRSIDILNEVKDRMPIYSVYLDIFKKVGENFNILRSLEVQDRWKSKFED